MDAAWRSRRGRIGADFAVLFVVWNVAVLDEGRQVRGSNETSLVCHSIDRILVWQRALLLLRLPSAGNFSRRRGHVKTNAQAHLDRWLDYRVRLRPAIGFISEADCMAPAPVGYFYNPSNSSVAWIWRRPRFSGRYEKSEPQIE